MRRLEAKGLARAKLRARRQRERTIRRRAIRGSLALFAVLWAIVFAQLVSGNDPALSGAPHSQHSRVAARKPEPAAEPEFDDEAEAPLPKPPEPEPAPIVTASS